MYTKEKYLPWSTPGVHKFYKNIDATSKFSAPQWQHDARSLLRTHKY